MILTAILQFERKHCMGRKRVDMLIIAVVFIAVLAVIGAIWFINSNRMPEIKLPTPVMPSPNAYDYYTSAGNLIVDSKKIDEIVYEQTFSRTRTSPKVYSLAEKEALLANNEPALQMMRDGFDYECMAPVRRSFDALFPEFRHFQNLGRLLYIESQIKSAKGDYAGAMDSCLDGIYFGVNAPSGGSRIHRLVGISNQKIVREDAWKLLEQMDAGECRAAAGRLEQIISKQVPVAKTLEEEKWFGIGAFQEAVQKETMGDFISSAIYDDNSLRSRIVWNIRALKTSKQKVIRNYSDYMDQLIENAKKPYALHLPDPPTPDDPVNSVLAPVLNRARFSDELNQLQNELLLLKLAIRAYKLDNGRYPASLSDLTPDYIKSIPRDRFVLKGPIRYKQQGSSYVLYSVGPDGKDDGGKPIDNIKSPSRPNADELRYHVEDKSKGDIVAGINLK